MLILRDTTERPEVVQMGAGILVGTDQARIIAESEKLLYLTGQRRTQATRWVAVEIARQPLVSHDAHEYLG